jgi:hypothetical protein
LGREATASFSNTRPRPTLAIEAKSIGAVRVNGAASRGWNTLRAARTSIGLIHHFHDRRRIAVVRLKAEPLRTTEMGSGRLDDSTVWKGEPSYNAFQIGVTNARGERGGGTGVTTVGAVTSATAACGNALATNTVVAKHAKHITWPTGNIVRDHNLQIGNL